MEKSMEMLEVSIVYSLRRKVPQAAVFVKLKAIQYAKNGTFDVNFGNFCFQMIMSQIFIEIYGSKKNGRT